MGIFEGFNLFTKQDLDAIVPSQSNIERLLTIGRYKRRTQVTDDDLAFIQEIEEDLDEITKYNIKLYDEFDCEDSDYRIVQIPEQVVEALRKAKDAIGILDSGGIGKYRREKVTEYLQKSPFQTPQSLDQELKLLFPEDYNRKLEAKGNWIMIIDDLAVDSAPEKYDIHYATPVAKPFQQYGYSLKRWYASIIVNNKEVLIEPREYIVIQDANWLLEMVDKGITLIEGSTSARLDKNKVFYLKSRGFNQAEIYQILFKSITNKGFCHFRVDPIMAESLDMIQCGVRPELAMRIEEHRRNLPNFTFKKPC